MGATKRAGERVFGSGLRRERRSELRGGEKRVSLARVGAKRIENAPSRLIVPLPPLLLPTNQQLLIPIRLIQPPLQLPHLTPLIKHAPLQIQRLELHPFSLSDLDKQCMGCVEVVAEADQALEVLLV